MHEGSENRTWSFATRAVHAGSKPDPVTGAIAAAISPSANYACRFGEIGFSAEGTDSEHVRYAYAREGHPNATQLEQRLASLEEAEAACVFASGIAAVIGNRAAIETLRHEIGTHLGAMLSPFNAWLIMRGIETLPIRMEAYAKSAKVVAETLKSHTFVREVRYPGLLNHPQHELAVRQMSNGSGMIAFTVEDIPAFGKSINHMSLFKFAASLGHSHSLILYCDTADLQRTTFQLDDDHLKRYRSFAGDGFFRLSIGLESPNDLCDDLLTALDRASNSGRPD